MSQNSVLTPPAAGSRRVVTAATLAGLSLTSATIVVGNTMNNPRRSRPYEAGHGFTAADLVADALLGRRPSQLIAAGLVTTDLMSQVETWVAANKAAALGSAS